MIIIWGFVRQGPKGKDTVGNMNNVVPWGTWNGFR